MKQRTYIRKGVWHLGRGKQKQKGVSLSLLAKSVLTTLAGAAGPPLLSFATKGNIW